MCVKIELVYDSVGCRMQEIIENLQHQQILLNAEFFLPT